MFVFICVFAFRVYGFLGKDLRVILVIFLRQVLENVFIEVLFIWYYYMFSGGCVEGCRIKDRKEGEMQLVLWLLGGVIWQGVLQGQREGMGMQLGEVSGYQIRGVLFLCEEVGFILGQGEFFRGFWGRFMVLKYFVFCKECGMRQDEGIIRGWQCLEQSWSVIWGYRMYWSV